MQEIERQARHDSLTDLPNRTLFAQRVEHAIAAARGNQKGFAVLLVDLDRFKEVNDTLGHQNGDRLLTRLSRRLPDHVRASDSVARLGGDEFAVLLSGVE